MYIIATDLDGTLLDDNGLINDEDLSFIKSLFNKDIIFLPISSRAYGAIPSFVKENVRYCGGSNGATIHDTLNNELLVSNLLDGEKVSYILDRIKDYNFAITIVQKSKMYTERKLADIYKNNKNLTNHLKLRTLIDDFKAFYDLGPVEKLHLNFYNDEERQKVLNIIKDIKDIIITSSGNYNIEITNPKATKGEAIKYFKDKYHVDSDACFAFGDNLNDAVMYDYVSNKIAMKNAIEALKEKANIITQDDNNHCGVIKYIRSHFNV